MQKWNKEVFGNIFGRKRDLMNRLNEVDNQLVVNISPALEDLKSNLWHELDQVLQQEELLWFQKSRSKWLFFGDRNTRYFHSITTIRHRKNTYDMLQDIEGNWIGEREKIEVMVTNYFQNLFSNDGPRDPMPISGAFPQLTEVDLRFLSKRITRKDIFNVVRHLNPFKAPGFDGLQAAFFQSQWEFIGDSFCAMIFDIFRNPEKVNEINNTLITLIPKIDPVVNNKNFRPISLCNVSYKVVTKILAHCLRLLMGVLVNPCQSSFIPQRQSRDNIILAQEIFHSMRVKKGRTGWMAIKLDLEKAYDRLNWSFIKETLEDIGLPGEFINLIWHCISSPKLRILWNGEALEEFAPTRGIRQGDPISPYLFVLCIEKLFQMIVVAEDHNQWRPI